MKDVFVSYRRSDSSHVTGRIFDHLKAQFGEDRLFKDVDSIPLGADFRGAINNAVGNCKVLLAIIGDGWLDARYPDGTRRIERSDDYVRIEILAAFERQIPVIPVLVGNASMPKDSELPAELKALVYRNAAPVRPDPDFVRDMERLFQQLARHLPRSRASRAKSAIRAAFAVVGLLFVGLTAWIVLKEPNFLKASESFPPIPEVTLTDDEAWEAIPPATRDKEASFRNAVGMRMVGIRPGRFEDPEKDDGRGTIEPKDYYWIADSEVSVAQFLYWVREEGAKEFLPNWLKEDSPEDFENSESEAFKLKAHLLRDGAPIVGVSPQAAKAFCQWLSSLPENTLTYRLPTRSEWVCAYRAGTKTRFWWGDQFECENANLKNCDDGFPCLTVSEKFGINSWGMRHIAGNAREMIDDGQSLAGGGWDSEDPNDASAELFAPYDPERSLGCGFRVVAANK